MTAKPRDEHLKDIRSMAEVLATAKPHGTARALANDYRNATPEQVAQLRGTGPVIDVAFYSDPVNNPDNIWYTFNRLADLFGGDIPTGTVVLAPDVPSFGNATVMNLSANIAHNGFWGPEGAGPPATGGGITVVSAAQAKVLSATPQLCKVDLNLGGAMVTGNCNTSGPPVNELVLAVRFRPLSWGADMQTPEAVAISNGLASGVAQTVRVFLWVPGRPLITLNATLHPQTVPPPPIPYFSA